MKFYFLNDINYLFRRRKKILLCLILFPLMIACVNGYQDVPIPMIEIVHLSTGTNYDVVSQDTLKLMMYLFNISVYIFLIIDLYVKDIKYQLDNIFLREKPAVWFIKKILIFMTSTFIIKLFQYLMITGILLINNSNTFNNNIFSLLMVDYLYVILIGFIMLLYYLAHILFLKVKFVGVIGIGIIIIAIPKNIWLLKDKVLFMVLAIIIIQVMIYYIFKLKARKVIENI